MQIGKRLLIRLCLREITVQMLSNRPALVRGCARFQRCRALKLRRGAGRSLQMQDLHLRVCIFARLQRLCQPRDRLVGSLSEIRADPACIE